MKLHTQRDAIRESVDLFCRNYEADMELTFCSDIQAAIHLLRQIGSDNLTAEQFDRITGTTGWCSSKCDECGKIKDVLVRFREEFDQPSSFLLCYECLLKAARVVEDHVIPDPQGLGVRGKVSR
jgi:hypothetical protein